MSLMDLLTMKHLKATWRQSPGLAAIICLGSLATIHGPIAAIVWMALKA